MSFEVPVLNRPEYYKFVRLKLNLIHFCLTPGVTSSPAWNGLASSRVIKGSFPRAKGWQRVQFMDHLETLVHVGRIKPLNGRLTEQRDKQRTFNRTHLWERYNN